MQGRLLYLVQGKAKKYVARTYFFALAPRVRLERTTSTAVRLLVNSRSHIRGCILLLERTTLQLETMVVSALLFSCLRLPVSAHPQAPFSRHRRRSLSAQLTAGAAVRYAGSSALSGSRQSKKVCRKDILFCFGSSSPARTDDPAVNSRMLCQLSYRGILK